MPGRAATTAAILFTTREAVAAIPANAWSPLGLLKLKAMEYEGSPVSSMR